MGSFYMNIKKILILFALSFFSFIGYFMRPTLLGFDSYGFLMGVCSEKGVVSVLGQQAFLVDSLFSWIPCDLFIIKIILFFLYFLAVCVIALIGETFDKKDGWLAGIFVFLSPLIFYAFTDFENDVFGFFLLFFSAFLYFKGITQTGKTKHIFMILSCFLVLIAGLIWEGAIYWIIPFGLLNIWFAVPTLILMLFYSDAFFMFLMPNSVVFEYMSWIGLGYLFFLMIGYVGITKKTALFVVWFTALTILKAKFAILCIPFLAVGILEYLKRIKNDKFRQEFKTILLIGAVFMALSMNFIVFTQYPTQEYTDMIISAVEKSQDNEMNNDWGIGWIVKYYGGHTASYASVNMQKPFNDFNGYILTAKDLNCAVSEQSATLTLYNC